MGQKHDILQRMVTELQRGRWASMNQILHRFILVFLCGGYLCILPASVAQEDKTKPDFEIPATHIEVRVLPKDHVPKLDLLPAEAAEQAAPPRPSDPMEALQYDVETIRDEMRLLQATLDLLINQIMADMREENEFLRQEVQRLSQMQSSYGLPDPAKVPRPGIGIIRDVLESQREQADPAVSPWQQLLDEYEASRGDPETQPPPSDEPFAFTPLQEWGRTPEMVEELGGDAVSLKGLVGVVPRGSSREDIEALGRQLRQEYDAYDNINIEVFDDEEAAQHFIETQVGHPEHRVLSISKHAASGRDVILYLNKGEASDVLP